MRDLSALRDCVSRLGYLSVQYAGDKAQIGSKSVSARDIRAAGTSPDFVVERFRDKFGVRWLWITFAHPVGPTVPPWAHTRGW